MAILRQQTNFVEQLYNSGMLDEQEQEQLLEPVEKKQRMLQRKGAVWRAPRIVDVGPRLPSQPPPPPCSSSQPPLYPASPRSPSCLLVHSLVCCTAHV